MAEEKDLPTPPPQQVTGSSVVHADGQYPLLDIDPHFSRVVRYFRPSDYAVWAGLTAGIPGLLYGWSQPSSLLLQRALLTVPEQT